MISLCMICGNEEAVITACLDSARDAFDELCLVQNIGSLAPDRTMDLAESWCEENGKDYKEGEYLNQVQDWPHTEDFGAARNQSFDLATGDWILWLDCDDYLDEINCARIREAVKVAQHDVIFCSYLVEKNGGPIMRERLMRRGSGRWKGTVHETCVTTGTIVNCEQIQVFHCNHEHKHSASAERNARLLGVALEDSARHWFYLHADLKILGKTDEAIRAARIALVALEDRQTEERYCVLLNLAEMEPETREQSLLAAFGTQPHRREAPAYLCQDALERGAASEAKSWFRIMDALPAPAPLPWTHQGIWYGWARDLLRIRVLRLSGQMALADTAFMEHSKDPDFAQAWAKYEHPDRLAAGM